MDEESAGRSKMKTKKIIFYILMLLPLAATLIAIPLLPDEIPAHYGANNQVDRWGSKYEVLIFPAITVAFGLFMLWMAKIVAKHEENGSNNENVFITAGICSTVVFDVMTMYFLYTAFNMVENLSDTPVGLNQLIFGTLGVFMIIVGNVMPKVRMNSLLGLRTSWSMKNETTWKKSQRFGGLSFIIAGVILLALCCLTRGVLCLTLSVVVLIAMLVADVYYTYKVSLKY